MAGADVEGVLIHNDGERGQQVVHVRQGLTHAHEHEVIHPRAAYLLRSEDLTYNLRRGQVTRKPQQATGAELASEGATHLRGNAKGDAVTVSAALPHGCGDDDGLH